jgi:hypothetical protein
VFVEEQLDFRAQGAVNYNHVTLASQNGTSIRDLKINLDFKGNPQARPWPSQFFADS